MIDVPGAWTVTLCASCFYTWRSTEPDVFRVHDRYDPRFKLNAADIARFTPYPPLPPRRLKSEPE